MLKPKVALVLGAGSARGLAHIGVLQVFEENDVHFDFIVGCSMGAMVGGIYACGTNLYMLDKMIETINHNIFFDVHIPRLGFIAGKKISTFLELMTKKKDFSQLEIPLTLVATDLVNRQKIILEEGVVAEAIRASISIPGVFNPVIKDDMVLVDGAVLDRLPISVAREKGADIIIAIDVSFGGGKKDSIQNTLDVIMVSIDIMQEQQFNTQFELINPACDILIQPKVKDYSPRDFKCSRELINLGREAAQEKLAEIEAKINGFSKVSST